jgi:translation elongation factor EF-1beta
MPVAMACLGHTTVDAKVHGENVAALKAVCKVLNAHLADQHFLVGDNLTVADVVTAGHLSLGFQTVLDAAFRKSMPDVSEWFERVVGLPSFVRRCGYMRMTKKAVKAFNPNATPEELAADVEEPAAEEDDLDLFGDDEPAPVVEMSAGKKKAMEMKAKAKADAEKKKAKKPVIAKSSVMFAVNPIDDETDLDALAKRIWESITMDGLVWGLDMKKEPVAFGIFKLIVCCVVEDEKVSVDDVEEKITEMDDMVNSV